MATESSADVLAHCKAHMAHIVQASPVYSHFFRHASLVFASPGRVVVRLTIEQLHLNSKSGLHGSVIATLVDFIGGVAIASSDLRNATGLSTDMHISFLSSARQGDVVDVEGRADRVGASLGFTTATIYKVVDVDKIGQGPVVATGSHTKYVKQRPA